MTNHCGITARAIKVLWDEHDKEVAKNGISAFELTDFCKAARVQEEKLGKEISEFIQQYLDGLITASELVFKLHEYI